MYRIFLVAFAMAFICSVVQAETAADSLVKQQVVFSAVDSHAVLVASDTSAISEARTSQVDIADSYFIKGNYAKAAQLYGRMVDSGLTSPRVELALYRSYLMSGQLRRARAYAYSMDAAQQELIALKTGLFEYVALSGGFMNSDNRDAKRIKYAQYDSINQYQRMHYVNFAMGFNLGASSKLSLGYQYFSNKFLRTSGAVSYAQGHADQHQGVASFSYFSKHNLELGLSSSVFRIDRLRNAYDSPQSNELMRSSIAYSILAFAAKRYTYFTPELSLAYSTFADTKQYQAKAMLSYFPLGNLDFYGSSSVAYIRNDKAWKLNQYVFAQNFAMKLANPIWLQVNASIGNHLNYISERGMLIFDTFDPIKAIAGLTLMYYVGPFALSTSYQWQQREGYAYSYTGFKSYKYNNHLIDLSFSWNI